MNDSTDRQLSLDAAMTGLRVLFLPKNNLTDYLVPLVKAAKARWDWRIDVLGEESDRPAFKSLTTDSGTLFVPPDPLYQAAWEEDPESVCAIDQRIREAEAVTGIPMGRVVLAGGRSIGRAFVAPMRYMPSTRVARRVLRDNCEPSRIVRRWFRFAGEVLDASAPDLIIAGQWATALHYTVWIAAARRGIPCVANRLSKINSDHCFWTTDREMLNGAARSHSACGVPPDRCADPLCTECPDA